MRISDWSSDVCSSDLPARRRAIEAGIAFQWHDQVDLAQGVTVFGAGDVLHFDHIHRIAVQFGVGFDDAAVAYAAMFVFAHPAVFYTLLTGLEDALAYSAFVGKQTLQVGLERRVQRTAADLACKRLDQLLEACCAAHVRVLVDRKST